MATEWPMQAGPWPASVTEKQRNLPARVELNSNHSAEGKNVWSLTSTPWGINYIDQTSILNRTFFMWLENGPTF
jgi:hypothetical protein